MEVSEEVLVSDWATRLLRAGDPALGQGVDQRAINRKVMEWTRPVFRNGVA